MTASTASQTSLKHSFSEEIHKHISLSRVSFNFQDISSGIDDFSNPFGELFENPELNQSQSD